MSGKKIRHATNFLWRLEGEEEEKNEKKEKERNSNRKKFVIHCLKEAHKVRRRSKKYRSYFRSPKITEDAPRGSRMIFPRRFYSRRVLEKDERMDEDSVTLIIGGRERERQLREKKRKDHESKFVLKTIQCTQLNR